MPARTNSCVTCRKKRIKCDATVPKCLMCIRTGHDCPGLPDGPVFVDMTNIAKHGMRKRKSKLTSKSAESSTLSCARSDQVLSYQISQRAVVTEAFYAHFMAHFTSEGESKDIRNQRTWLHSLPVLTTDGTNEALTTAAQATASAYCAAESGNMALTQYSWKMYGEALRAHSRFVSRLHTKQEVTVHMVSTSVLFSLFEAMQSTNAAAYCSHVFGAVRMLELTTPKQCSQGALCQIFYHLRTQLTFINLTGNSKRIPFRMQGILYGPLRYVELPRFQTLMGYVSDLVDVYVARKTGASRPEFGLDAYTVLESNIEVLWLEYMNDAVDTDKLLLWEDTSTETRHFRDAFTALVVAYFSVARILLSLITPRLLDGFPTLSDDYTSVLLASQYLQTHTVGCAYMRMATPLLLVALHSPEPSQRNQATAYFEGWTQRSMSGVSTLALETIRRNHVYERDRTREQWQNSALINT